MGFLSLLNASKLSASYDFRTQILTLNAEGTIAEYTYGIQFFRFEPVVGDYKFRLEGWVGPLNGRTESYTYSQNFKIPFFFIGGKYVIVEDAGYPKGIPVLITFTGIIPQEIQAIEDAPTPAQESKVITTTSQKNLKVLYKEPFDIFQADEVPNSGCVDIKYDQCYLTLETAGIINGNIVWNFNSVQTGNTQIIITVHGGIASFIQRIVYDVEIFVLESEPNHDIKDEPNLLGNFDADKIPLSFVWRASIGMRKILDKYPKAIPYSIEATTPASNGVSNPDLLPQMTVVALLDRDFAIVKSAGGASFGAVELVLAPLLLHAPIEIPVSFDAREANVLLRKAGFEENYTALALLDPSPFFKESTIQQDYYVFHMKDGKNVFVGTKDRKVTVG